MSQEVLAGRAAVVTGGSSGIGRAIALRLAALGADVMVHAGKNRTGADETAEHVRQFGRDSNVHLADLADPDGPSELIEAAWQWRNDISIWINNAGADVLTGEAGGWDFLRKLDHLYRVDVRAGIELARAAGARMRRQVQETGAAPASLITIGWDQVQTGMGGDSGEMFAAVKGAVMAFSLSLARSLAPHVRVNCVAPGWIKTAWGEEASSYWSERAVNESLLARWGEPEDVAAAVAFLVSPQADFITSQTLPVNGGFRHRDQQE